MKNTICQSATSLWEAVKSQEMRHHLHCDWGLFKSREDKHPLLSFRLHHECVLPLIKVMAVIGIMIATCTSICAITTKIKHLCLGKTCRW